MAEPKKEEELDTRTRLQIKKELHERKTAERKANSEQLATDYAQIKDSPALADILAKARSFRNYHQKLASDGVGAKVVSDPEGESGQRVVEYELNDSQTFRELGGASALDQLIVYIENKLS
mgnify:FL=1